MCVRAYNALVLKLDYLSTTVCQKVHYLPSDAILRILTRASCACPRTFRVRIRKMASLSAASKRLPCFQSSYILVLSWVYSKQPIFGLIQEWFLESCIVESTTSYTFPVQTGGIFYFPWHRHQIEAVFGLGVFSMARRHALVSLRHAAPPSAMLPLFFNFFNFFFNFFF